VPLQICIDRPLPLDRQNAAAERAVSMRSDNAALDSPGKGQPGLVRLSMALITKRRWPPGQELRVAFLNGTDWQRGAVTSTAVEWGNYANIGFAFGVDPAESQIRIAFVTGVRSCSRLGMDALDDGADVATMQFGWVEPTEAEEDVRAVILHEFGHALGCIHEHSNPAASIPWDKEKVYEYYMGPDVGWTREEVDRNLFQAYDRDLTKFSAFDRASIMLYPIPEEHTIGDFSVGMNSTLSDGDKAFISRNYPRDMRSLELPLNGQAVAGSASPEEQEDTFLIDVKTDGYYEIATSGPTNVSIGLFGPDNPGRHVASDDDGGRDGYNAKLRVLLILGHYILRVHHANGGSGDYSVSASPVGNG
jgi:hypothetical protein